ncbi:hypothetical protein CYLTODRAFT_421836 [Cylindrobasidium torrendii FP15055 ss-10]|uniref:Uncharacterized protein n=1 Tax=Cylindrobasidium torrendii FP15055 ss-10 TaxID=1314674 RepID=A0A0D7BCB7_9AGAR|nr:hypothetical protein CYLTODRAFT_421836 [Cylindrobasidium torrendii FP15055 ss-10]
MVDSVPIEILAEIFSVAQDRDPVFADHATVTGNERIATVVSQVCQHWRNAAVGFPALWTYISYESREWDSLPRMTEHLLRAKDQPLTFSLRLTDPGKDTQYSDVGELLKNHLPQIEHIILQERNDQLLLLILLSGGVYTRRLRSLSLDYKNDYHVWRMMKPTFSQPGIGVFPYLHHLDLCRVAFDSFDALFPKLTTLSLSCIQFPRPGTLAPISRGITSLTLGPYFNGLEQHFAAPIIFPALEKLVVKDFGYFPRAILPPNLRQLEMLDFRLSIFNDFLMGLPRSWIPSPIKSSVDIHIKDSRHDDTWRAEIASSHGIISDLFEALPNVQNLRLDSFKLEIVQMWANTLSRGEGDDTSTWPWPNLRSITLADEAARAEMFFMLPEWRRGPFILGRPKDNRIILRVPDTANQVSSG